MRKIKQILVLCACLPLALILVLQIGVTIQNNSYAYAVSDMTEKAASEAALSGCFTQEIIDELKQDIAERTGAAIDEIEVSGTSEVKYRSSHYSNNSKICYRVAVPVKRLVVGGRLFGISDDDNKGMIIKEGYILSEKLP